MTSTNTIHHNNNITNLGGGSGGSSSANFGVYQQTSVGLSELSIRTLVPDAISAEPYRKALIAKLFFHQILSLTDSPSVTFNDLLATVAAYFDINTGSAEREAEAAAQSLSRSFFHVSNLVGVAFSDASGNLIKVPDTADRPADITYFTFRSIVNANSVDCRAPNKSLALEFSLRLPQTLGKLAVSTAATPIAVTTSPNAVSSQKKVEDLEFTLGNLSDDILTGMDTTALLKLVIEARDTITSVSSPRTQPIAPSNLFSTPQSLSVSPTSHSRTPKMDRVRSVIQSNEVMTFNGSLDIVLN